MKLIQLRRQLYDDQMASSPPLRAFALIGTLLHTCKISQQQIHDCEFINMLQLHNQNWHALGKTKD